MDSSVHMTATHYLVLLMPSRTLLMKLVKRQKKLLIPFLTIRETTSIGRSAFWNRSEGPDSNWNHRKYFVIFQHYLKLVSLANKPISSCLIQCSNVPNITDRLITIFRLLTTTQIVFRSYLLNSNWFLKRSRNRQNCRCSFCELKKGESVCMAVRKGQMKVKCNFVFVERIAQFELHTIWIAHVFVSGASRAPINRFGVKNYRRRIKIG